MGKVKAQASTPKMLERKSQKTGRVTKTPARAKRVLGGSGDAFTPMTPGWTQATTDLFDAPSSPSPKQQIRRSRRTSVYVTKSKITSSIVQRSLQSSEFMEEVTFKQPKKIGKASPAVTRARRVSKIPKSKSPKPIKEEVVESEPKSAPKKSRKSRASSKSPSPKKRRSRASSKSPASKKGKDPSKSPSASKTSSTRKSKAKTPSRERSRSKSPRKQAKTPKSTQKRVVTEEKDASPPKRARSKSPQKETKTPKSIQKRVVTEKGDSAPPKRARSRSRSRGRTPQKLIKATQKTRVEALKAEVKPAAPKKVSRSTRSTSRSRSLPKATPNTPLKAAIVLGKTATIKRHQQLAAEHTPRTSTPRSTRKRPAATPAMSAIRPSPKSSKVSREELPEKKASWCNRCTIL